MRRIYEFIMTMATDGYEGSIPSLVTNEKKSGNRIKGDNVSAR